MKQKSNTGGARFWSLMWALGLAGQLCWNIENQWFNTFVYAKIAKDSSIVTLMVILSALVTTFSTFFFGTASDRAGQRRKFISIGYILWGIFTICFGLTEFISRGAVGENAKLILLASVLVVLSDCVMSFFGSMGNDSGYNAWTNDMTTDKNRGQIGAVLATQPVFGTIVGTILGGILVGDQDNYQRLFWAMGIFVILVGICSLLFLKESPALTPHRDGSFWHQFSQVFHFRGFFDKKELIYVCLTATFYFIPFNIYFVHMGNWMIHHLGFTAGDMGLIQGAGLILAMILVLPSISLINKNRTPLLAFGALIINMLGLWLIYFCARPDMVDTANLVSVRNLPLLICVFLVGSGYVLMSQAITMWVKQLYPQESRGQFEGVRVLFFTLIPMMIGTVIGNIIIKGGSGTVVNEYGITENIPTESIFFWAALLLLPTFIPLFFASLQSTFGHKSK